MSLRKRIREWIEDRVVERVTRPGVAFLFAIVLTGLAAFVSANNLIFLLLAVMIAAVLVSGFISRLTLAGLELDLVLPDHITARQPTPARLLLKNEKSWFPSFSVRVTGMEGSLASQSAYFPLVPPSGVVHQNVNVLFSRRGAHRGESFRFSSRFPFGFAERRMRVSMSHEVVVYPSLAPQPGFEQLAADISGEADHRFRGRGHDFYRIRPYQPPESARHVDWRKTAHAGELMVREFARERDPHITLYFDLDQEPAAPAWFEHAVECAAYLAWHILRRGARLQFHSQTCSFRVPNESDIYAILKYLALVEPQPGAGAMPSPDEETVPIVLTAEPARHPHLRDLGARFLDPASLPVPGRS